MKITVAAIGPSRTRVKSEAVDGVTLDYVARASRYVPCDLKVFGTETALLEALDLSAGRVPAHAILLDSTGRMLTSEQFATHLGALRDGGVQRVITAIGPASGWSSGARARADLLFSFGRVTLPHGLARAVLAEQVYRALTILSGHPYHCGH